MTDCGDRRLGFKSPGSILTSGTATNSLSRVVRDGWDPCPEPLSGRKKVSCGGIIDLAVEQPQLFRKQHKNKNKNKNSQAVARAYRPPGVSTPLKLWVNYLTILPTPVINPLPQMGEDIDTYLNYIYTYLTYMQRS